MKSQSGFTLIELLIVVAVIGILAAVIVPNVMTFMKSGTAAAANMEAAHVGTAALGYFADSGTYPDTSDELYSGNVTYLSKAPKADYTFSDNGTGIIISAIPADNGNGAWTNITWADFKWKVN